MKTASYPIGSDPDGQPMVYQASGLQGRARARAGRSLGKLDQDKPTASLAGVVGRMAAWASALSIMTASMMLDRLTRRATASRDAVRLRRTLERLGPTAIKIGQQLSIRTDLIPKEYSEELMGLLDQVPPFPPALARQRVERELGRPIESIFREFGREPIGSASIACVFKAVLLDGSVVAVKIRRPGVAGVLTADLKALTLLFDLLERMGVIERGRSEPVVNEFRVMLLDELNFLIEARQTELFRSDAARSNRYVTAPRVHLDLSTTRILVTEFIDGLFLKRAIEAIEADDRAFLDRIASQGYDLSKVGRRLVGIYYWQLFENSFFHADPHPSNVIIKPDNTLVFIDFGATGTITSKYRSDLMRFIASMARRDVDGMVRHMISSLEPLPRIDLDAYTNEMYHAMREYLFTSRSRNATWQERSSGRAMTAIAEVSRKYKIPMRADVLRYMRASFQFDSIIYRLDPGLDSQKEFRRYLQQRAKRSRRAFRRQLRRVRGSGLASVRNLVAGLQERFADVETVVTFLGKHTSQLDSLFYPRVDPKGLALAGFVRLFRIAFVAGLLFAGWSWARGHNATGPIPDVLDWLAQLLLGPEAGRFAIAMPPLTPRSWFWISLGGIAIFAATSRVIRELVKPRSKIE